MADNTPGTQVVDPEATTFERQVNPAADIRNGYMGNIYTYERDLAGIHESRTATYDIGAEDSPMRVQGMDTYARQQGASNFDSDSEAGRANMSRVPILRAADKRAQYERNTFGSKLRLREYANIVGKKLVCSQCVDADGTPNCTWHMSAVGNIQTKLEVFAKAYLAKLQAEGRLVDPKSK